MGTVRTRILQSKQLISSMLSKWHIIVLVLSQYLAIAEALVLVEKGAASTASAASAASAAVPNITALSSGCPAFTEIPVAELFEKNPEKDYFYGGRKYHGKGNSIPALACNGGRADMPDGYKSSAPAGLYLPIGSLMINPGCSFYMFEDYNQEGRYVEYTGGNTGRLVSEVPRPSWSGSCGVPCFKSLMMSCRQRFPNCAPEDGWETIATLDNTGSSVEVPFTFQQTIGTTWSNEVSENMHTSSRVEASISVNFFAGFESGFFSAGGGVDMGSSISEETGMDWGSVSRQEKSETETYKVGPINVPAGGMLWIQAAIGHCGGSTVDTHVYKVISTYNSGSEQIINSV